MLLHHHLFHKAGVAPSSVIVGSQMHHERIKKVYRHALVIGGSVLLFLLLIGSYQGYAMWHQYREVAPAAQKTAKADAKDSPAKDETASQPAPTAPKPDSTTPTGNTKSTGSSGSSGGSTTPSTGAGMSTTSGPSGQSMPTSDIPGWKHIFSDDFTTNAALGSFDTVYASKGASYGHWPDTAAQHYTKMSGYFTEKVVSVNAGVLDKYLHTEYSATGTTKSGAGNYMMSAALQPRIFGSGTSGSRGQLYGRYSVRLKADAIAGYKIAWLLWPDSSTWPRDGEIDFAETNLTSPLGAFIHKQNGSSGSDQTPFHTSPAVYLSSGWHTVTLEWDTTTKIYVDGVLEGQSSDRIPNTPMHAVLQTESELTSTTSTASGHLQLDWVSIWSKN